MACCKCCCGGTDCAEGQQGKCCCGGPLGYCCQEGEYCCSGQCQPYPCGACCLPDGTCTEEYATRAQCEANGGTWHAGVRCASNPCIGACCLPDGTCVDNSTPSACASQGGTFHPGKTCQEVTCTGACCLPDGTCQGDTTQAACEGQGGTFHPGVQCADVTCPQCDDQHPCPEGQYCCNGQCQPEPCGACCLPDGTCRDDLTQVECESGLGTCREEILQPFQPGVGLLPCPDGYYIGNGGFCVKDTVTTSAECPQANNVPDQWPTYYWQSGQAGTWHAGVQCQNAPCDCYGQAIPAQSEAAAIDACNNPQGCAGTISDCAVYAPNTPNNPSPLEWLATRTCCPSANPLP